MAYTYFYPDNYAWSGNSYEYKSGWNGYKMNFTELNKILIYEVNGIPQDHKSHYTTFSNSIYVQVKSIDTSAQTATLSIYSNLWVPSGWTSSSSAWSGYNSRCYRRFYVNGSLKQTSQLTSASIGTGYQTTPFTATASYSQGYIEVQYNWYGYNDDDSTCPVTFYQTVRVYIDDLLPKNECNIIINGSSKKAKVYLNINNEWKEAKPYVLVNGSWKEVKSG